MARIDGPIFSIGGTNPITGAAVAQMFMASVGYEGEAGVLPAKGTPYICNIMVGVDTPTLGGDVLVKTGIFLPPGTSFTAQPEKGCFLTDVRTGQRRPVTTEEGFACSVFPTPFENGAANLGERLIPAHHIFEFFFEVVTTGEMQAAALVGFASAFLGKATPDVLNPSVQLDVVAQGFAPPPPFPTQVFAGAWRAVVVAFAKAGSALNRAHQAPIIPISGLNPVGRGPSTRSITTFAASFKARILRPIQFGPPMVRKSRTRTSTTPPGGIRFS